MGETTTKQSPSLQRLMKAFNVSEGPRTQAPPKSPMAGVLETLHGELERVETSLIKSTAPVKPAILAGKFNYANSVVKGTERRLSAIQMDEVTGAKFSKVAVQGKAKDVNDALEKVKATQIGLSLAELGKQVKEALQKASEIKKRSETAASLQGEEKKTAQGEIYQDASEALTEIGREIADWTGQVKEATGFLGNRVGNFNKALVTLGAAETALSKVIESCLPQLKSRPMKEGETLPTGKGGAQEAPKVGDDPLKALKECGNTWVGAKQKFGAFKDEMQKLADYRKERVDKWLNDTLPDWGMKYGPKVGWVSVGSSDPTSDYDISLNKHGQKGQERKYDYQFVQEFNAWFRKEFGGEGGTVFDTNLYASAEPLVKDPDPEGATNDVAALMKMRRYMTSGEFEEFRVETVEACGADEAQRMKVEKQFAMADDNYRVVILQLLENGRAMLQKRIEEREKIKKPSEMDTDERGVHDIEKAGVSDIDKWLAKGKQAGSGIESVGLIDEGEELSRVIDHLLKDAALQTTNEVYASKVGEVRDQERMIQLLQDLQEGLKTATDAKTALGLLEPVQAEFAKIMRVKSQDGPDLGQASHSVDAAIAALKKEDGATVQQELEKLRKSLTDELGIRLQQLGTTNAISRYFANEAYQSDGPFAHVVTATQAAEAEATNATVKKETEGKLSEAERKDKDAKTQIAMVRAGGAQKWGELEKGKQDELLKAAQADIDKAVKALKKERQDELPADQCLQSFNEQLGDFLKDLEHYGADEPGKAIIQSSKYLERLLDATRLMHDKELFGEAGDLIHEIENQLKLQDSVKKELIAARKGNLQLMPLDGDEPVDQQEQRRAYACDFMKKLGVTSVPALAKKYTAFGVKVNAAARKALAAARS